MDQPRILVVDDNRKSRTELVAVLEKAEFNVAEVVDGLGAIKAVRKGNIDAVLLDRSISGIDGMELLEYLAHLGDNPPVCILISTQRSVRDGEVARALGLGAVDFLIKPYDVSVLIARLRYALRVAQDAKDHHDEPSEGLAASYTSCLRAISHRDDVTGMYNAAFLFEELERAFTNARRTSHVLTCVAMEVDGLAEIEKRFGRAVAEKVLCDVATAMEGACRHTDVVARLTGGVFAILFPGCRLLHAKTVIERVRSAVSQQSHMIAHLGLPALTTSAAISATSVATFTAGDQLFDSVLETLRVVRDLGGDDVITYTGCQEPLDPAPKSDGASRWAAPV